MSRIKIENWGPIESFNQYVDEKLMVLIGEQASGKSTIAKTIFFCKSIEAFMIDDISQDINRALDQLIDKEENNGM